MKILKMDKEGYERFLSEIDEVQKKLDNVRKFKGEVAIHQGDNWHDNPTLYSTEAEERGLMRQLYDMKEQLKNIEIVEKSFDDDVVEIGDIINVAMSQINETPNEMIFKLVGHSPKWDAEISEISVNSPLGSSVYKKKIGDKTGYKVGERQFNVMILEKIKLELDIEKSKVK